jgi:hypothetical protein
LVTTWGVGIDLEQFFLDIADDVGPRPLGALLLDNLVVGVEVLQVVRRDHAHAAHPADWCTKVRREEFTVDVEQLRQPVHAVDRHAACPTRSSIRAPSV